VTGDRDLIFDAIANSWTMRSSMAAPEGKSSWRTKRRWWAGDLDRRRRSRNSPPANTSMSSKRFYRLEHSRYTPGNGLGLSLVAAVARLHGARIEMLDNSPGLKFSSGFQRRLVRAFSSETCLCALEIQRPHGSRRAALPRLTMRVGVLILRSALLRASRRMATHRNT